ncbi:MAG: hypothetical protein ACI9FR_000965 [Cryomorphaceae bacterium]|jgi:uncharacterized protein (DUF934 family)
MVQAKNLKARANVAPSRIQENISRNKAIVDGIIVENGFVHIAETENLTLADLPSGDVSVPLNFWLENKSAFKDRAGLTAVQLGSDEEVADLLPDLLDIDIIVLPFVAHVDGRGYSQAHLLRERHAYKGQIRAVGDVKFDQLGFLARAGCNAFELPETENHQTALRALNEFTEVYQPAADGARSIFSRRRQTH